MKEKVKCITVSKNSYSDSMLAFITHEKSMQSMYIIMNRTEPLSMEEIKDFCMHMQTYAEISCTVTWFKSSSVIGQKK